MELKNIRERLINLTNHGSGLTHHKNDILSCIKQRPEVLLNHLSIIKDKDTGVGSLHDLMADRDRLISLLSQLVPNRLEVVNRIPGTRDEYEDCDVSFDWVQSSAVEGTRGHVQL